MSFLSLVTYPGDGATLPWTVPFPYLLKPHVKVYVSGVLQVLTTDYSWSTDSQITFVTAPASGAIILIRRETSPSTRLVDYVEGTLTESDLDTDSLQAFYLAQEARDSASLQLIVDLADERIEAGTRQIKNVVDPTSPSHVATKSYVDALTIGSGNLPAPNNPADDDKVVRATAGTFGWYAFLKDWISDATSFGKTWLGLADAQAARTNLSLALAAHGRCRLELNGSSLLELKKHNGNTLVINGKVEAIPATNPTLVATSLPADTTHFIYAYMSGATMTLEASTTARATDATTGIEIKSGDATRTLVGMARTVAGPAWIDSGAQRYVLSWFNQRPKVGTPGVNAGVDPTNHLWYTTSTAGGRVPTAGMTILGAPLPINMDFIAWSTSPPAVVSQGSGYNQSAGQYLNLMLAVDGTPVGPGHLAHSPGANQELRVTLASRPTGLSDGFHSVTVLASVGGGQGRYHSSQTTVTVQG